MTTLETDSELVLIAELCVTKGYISAEQPFPGNQ